MRAGVYTRVSTTQQDLSPQLCDLRKYCADRGIEIYREYCDYGVSGSKDQRPGLNAFMADARKRRFDTAMVWRFDRFARSTRHLVSALEEFQHLGINFISYSENIDTASPLGKAIFVIASAFAELERNITIERIKSGLRRAQAQGVVLGRPPKLDADLLGKIREMRASGASFSVIGRSLGIAKSTVYLAVRKTC